MRELRDIFFNREALWCCQVTKRMKGTQQLNRLRGGNLAGKS